VSTGGREDLSDKKGSLVSSIPEKAVAA